MWCPGQAPPSPILLSWSLTLAYTYHYLARAHMSPSPDSAEAVAGSWVDSWLDSWVDSWVTLSGHVRRIQWTDFNKSMYDLYWYGLVVHALV